MTAPLRGSDPIVVDVALGARSYDIVIEHGLLERAGERLAPYARGGRLVVVTDENVWAAQGVRLVRGLDCDPLELRELVDHRSTVESAVIAWRRARIRCPGHSRTPRV